MQTAKVMKHIVYPNYISALGGAVSVKSNARSAWVDLGDKVVRVPVRLLTHIMDDGMAVAQTARTYAYRNL